MKNDFIIETNMLKKQYGSQTVVNNVNLHIKKGRIYGLLGRNGAGKTTIMKMLMGLVSVTFGEIYLFGEKLNSNKNKIYPRIGSIIEVPGFYPNLTGRENLEIFAKLRGTIKKNAVGEALEIVDLPHNDNKKFAFYSLGMKQRLGIANAILNDPELLILDEPTNGLDPIGIAKVRTFLQNLCSEQGKTILISSHILSEISLMANDIGIIHEGNLLEETSLEDLEKKNEKYISIEVSNVPFASRILEREMAIKNYKVHSDNIIRIYELHHNTSTINKLLINSGVEVFALKVCNDNLEDYFKKITGGDGIA